MSTVLLPMNRTVELPPPAAGDGPGDDAGDDAGDGRALVGGWLVLPPALPVAGVLTDPAGTSCHCWLAPPQSRYCTTRAPSCLEAPWTSTAMPLKRLISRT